MYGSLVARDLVPKLMVLLRLNPTKRNDKTAPNVFGYLVNLK